jgi:RNA polymerase sigma-70 factor (ECF subfamily)
VFLRLWQHAGQFDPARSAFGAWFMAIARHRVLDELRRRGQARRLAVAGDVERLLVQAPDGALDPGAEVWLRDAARAVHHALAALPDDQRRVLVLGYFGGLTHSAMADLLGWPLGTVKKRVRLGLQKLRRSLAAFSDDPPPASEAPPPNASGEAPGQPPPTHEAVALSALPRHGGHRG